MNLNERRHRMRELEEISKANAAHEEKYRPTRGGAPSTWGLKARRGINSIRVRAARLFPSLIRSQSTRTYSADQILRGACGQGLRCMLKDGIEAGVIRDSSSGARKPEFRKSAGVVRSEMMNGKRKISGYAAVFSQLSEPLRIGNRTMRERVLPGAFDKCLASLPDVRALINHDPNLILGRSLANTLQLSVDSHGLRYSIDPPATSYANDLLVSLQRQDVSQSSFGFYTIEDDYLEDGDDGLIRQLRAVDLFDCSVVTFPAYTGSSSGVRSRSTEKRNDLCECDCPECQAGNCDDCTDEDCDDPNCRCM